MLEVNNLSICFRTRKESVHAVKNISLSLKEGSILGLVGESGSGKSVTALCLAGLLTTSKSASIYGSISLLGKPQTLKINRGRIVEIDASEKLYQNPRHPYTRLLLSSIPQAGTAMYDDLEDCPIHPEQGNFAKETKI